MFFYIDPGTGSMLFTILIGLFGAAIYGLKILKVKIKTMFGGKNAKKEQHKIPFVIYSDDKRYWPIFEPICRKLDTLDKEILYLTASEDDAAFNATFKNVKVECIGKGNSSFFRLNYLNANIVLSTTPSLNVFQWKRSKTVDYYVHITHSAGNVTMYRMFGIDYYDAILVSADYQVEDIRELEALRNLPEKEVVKVGIPYMDEMAKRVQKAGEVPAHTRTVLIAPTWGTSGMFAVYGGKIIEQLLQTGYHIIVRPHPQSFSSEAELMEELMTKYPQSDQLEWNRDTDNFEVLRRSDILVSDFSGVIYDFALVHGKPVLYTEPNFNLGPYDAWWLNKPVWTLSALERLGKQINLENSDKIKELIDECLDNPEMQSSLQEVKNQMWCYFGEGAERAFVYLRDKHQEILQEKEKQEVQAQTKKSKGFNLFKWFKKKKKEEVLPQDEQAGVKEEVSVQAEEETEPSKQKNDK